MELQQVRVEDGLILRVCEDILVDNVEDFRRIVEGTVEAGEKIVYLDLSGLDYICSAGIGVIARAHRLLAKDGRKLVVTNPTEKVSRLFVVTRLDTVLHIKHTAGN